MEIPQLDLQLAWAFREFPVVWDRLAERGVQLEDVERAWKRHLHMRNAGQTLLTLEVDFACGCRTIRHEYHDGSVSEKVILHDGHVVVDELLSAE